MLAVLRSNRYLKNEQANNEIEKMKMLSLGCKTIQDGLTTALIFLIAGICLILAGVWVMPEIWYLPHIIIFMGGLILFMVPVILLATYLKNR